MEGQQNQQQAAQQSTQPTGGNNDVNENKGIAYLSYLGILFLVPLLAKKESQFAQFHAKQGLIIVIGWFVGALLWPAMGLGALVQIAMIIFSIMGLINVNKGEMKEIPLIGGLAKKINL